jgi:hypothetical protein
MENGARRVMVPIENRRQFLEVSGDVAERLDPIFYGDENRARLNCRDTHKRWSDLIPSFGIATQPIKKLYPPYLNGF